MPMWLVALRHPRFIVGLGACWPMDQDGGEATTAGSDAVCGPGAGSDEGAHPPAAKKYTIVANKMIASTLPTGAPILRRGISGGGWSRSRSSGRSERNLSPNLSPL